MYDFHYNYFKTKYWYDIKLLLTNKDPLIYEIKTEDVYKDISSVIEKLTPVTKKLIIHLKLNRT